MKKFLAVITILGGVIFAYVLLLAAYPAFTGLVSSANASLPVDMSAYPGGREIITSAPWWLLFVPAVLGVGGVVWVLKFSKD